MSYVHDPKSQNHRSRPYPRTAIFGINAYRIGCNTTVSALDTQTSDAAGGAHGQRVMSFARCEQCGRRRTPWSQPPSRMGGSRAPYRQWRDASPPSTPACAHRLQNERQQRRIITCWREACTRSSWHVVRGTRGILQQLHALTSAQTCVAATAGREQPSRKAPSREDCSQSGLGGGRGYAQCGPQWTV